MSESGTGPKAKLIIGLLAVVAVGAIAFALLRRPDDSELRKVQKDVSDLRSENSDLKERNAKLRAALNQALAQPGTIKLDPELLRLIGRPEKPSARAGDLARGDVEQVVRQNKDQFQSCYERALKRNAELRSASVRMNLAFAVHGNGSVGSISIAPRVDEGMVACMTSAVNRWKFPAFGGESVRVEIPVPLVPKE